MITPRDTAGRVLLGSGAAILAAFGICFLGWPRWIGAPVGLANVSPIALTDLRAVYGGFQLAMALFLARCALGGGSWVRPGLLAATLGSGGFAVGRLVSWSVDGPLARVHLAMLVFELLCAGIALAVYRAGASFTASTVTR